MSFLPTYLNHLAPVLREDLIRLGRKNDGGYVIPRYVFKECDTLLSLGICDDWSFDLQFKEHLPEITIHAYDHTTSRRQMEREKNSQFRKLFKGKSSWADYQQKKGLLESYDSFFSLHASHFQERVRSRIEQINDVTIDTIFSRINGQHLFLKMDIEGDEYRIIDDILRYASSITALAIEFHHTDHLRMVFLAAIEKLLQHYEIVHLHANNWGFLATDGLPDVLEITFLDKRLSTGSDRRSELPIIGLDAPNNPNRLDYFLKFQR